MPMLSLNNNKLNFVETFKTLESLWTQGSLLSLTIRCFQNYITKFIYCQKLDLTQTQILLYVSINYICFPSRNMDAFSLKGMLQRIQNKCLRICLRTDVKTSNFEVQLKSRVLPLHYRRKTAIGKYLFKKVFPDPTFKNKS